jgi:hypothetical protein
MFYIFGLFFEMASLAIQDSTQVFVHFCDCLKQGNDQGFSERTQSGKEFGCMMLCLID